MLKKIFITLGLLCAYLSLMIILSNLGITDAINIIIASVLFGCAMYLFIHKTYYFIFNISITTIIFVLAQDYTSIPIMLISLLFGYITVHYFKTRKRRKQHARRRPLNENREFLN